VDSIAVLDFGSQYAQLIARRVREAQVYCELFPFDAPAEAVLNLNPCGFILSGGPASVYDANAPRIPDYVLQSELPILGICYGMQALTAALGGRVAAASEREYGQAYIHVLGSNPLLPPGEHSVWMSHGDRIEQPPPGFEILAESANSPIAGIGDAGKRRYGLQFHPEVQHTPAGAAILQAFVEGICGAAREWRPESMIDLALQQIHNQVGEERVLAGVSGGVDSTVAAALVHRAIGDRLECIFVNNGLMRSGEPQTVVEAFRNALGARLHPVDASEGFLDALSGVTDPEQKRRIVGEQFIRVFEREAERIGPARFLLQGTIYPDVVESSGPDRRKAQRIKTHHNVGGLPADMAFELVEPLRYLFKDEVRAVGRELGLPAALIDRQPFPGPGLAVRCLGEVTFERLSRLRQADEILQFELREAGVFVERPGGPDHAAGTSVAQAFAVLLPVRSVGVMGDQRTYAEVVAIRAVTTEDFMTADWARLPADLLGRISSRIVNEVAGVNRVVYDVTSKPPGTIEWE
jgi:GMP synthase (glutamine-hydrolysing)